MDRQCAAGTVDRPGTTTERLGMDERCSDIEVSESPPTRFLVNIESAIQRYPWPTLLLGFSIGYLLSRRMR